MLNLDWEPKVHSASCVDIPCVSLSCEDTALQRWRAAHDPWLQSNRTNYSVWGEYAALAESGRFVLPYARESPTKRFAELHTALALQQHGFKAWGGVHLFQYGKQVGKGKGNTLRSTNEVRDRWPRRWRWPDKIQASLNARPRNPDLVAYSEDRNKWYFCEAKLDDPIDPEQWMALAVLHLLTGAPVAVVRVTRAPEPPAPQFSSIEIAFKEGEPLGWIKWDLVNASGEKKVLGRRKHRPE